VTDNVTSRVPRVPWYLGAVKRARMPPLASILPVPISFVPDSFAVHLAFALKPLPVSSPLPLLR
jgi:hypothetical protein